MAQHVTSLPKEPTGTGAFVDFCKKSLRCILERSLIAGPGIRASYTSKGVIVEAIAETVTGKAQPTSIKRYLVKSVQSDHLVCREMSGSTPGSTDIQIAKPFDLRSTGWNGQTITYSLAPYPGAPPTRSIQYSMITPILRLATVTAGGASASEYQEIIPYYVPDKSIIFAVEPENDTGVAGVTWQDLNADGRAWSRAI